MRTASAVALASGVAAGALWRRAGRGIEPEPERRPVPAPRPASRPRDVVTADGVGLHVEEVGPDDAAASVVLLHGYHQSSRLWNGQVHDLHTARPDLRIVTYDHRGHGRSGRTGREAATIEQLGRDLDSVIDVVAPDGPVVLIGHSIGGMTIMALAEHRPAHFTERVAGIGFVATSSGELSGLTFGLPKPLGRLVALAVPRLDEKALRDERAGRPHRIAPATARVIFGPGADPEDVRTALADMAECPAESVAFFRATFRDHDRRAALAAVAHVPGVVLVGDRDVLCPPEHSRAIAESVPSAELVVYPGAGHMVQLERRVEVSRRLVALLDRAVPQAVAAGQADSQVMG